MATTDMPIRQSASAPTSPPTESFSRSSTGSPPSQSVQDRKLSSSPPTDALRHVQSNTALTPGSRNPNRLSAHMGKTSTKSPSTSIPSSPTSVHSSSSAIFERDIEPIGSSPSSLLTSPTTSLSPNTHEPSHHLVPHARASPLDATVPTVLDSAAQILSQLSPTEVVTGDGPDAIAVLAPSTSIIDRSGFSSPTRGGARSIRSRSPSPSPNSRANRASLLLNLPPPNISPPPMPNTAHVATPIPGTSPSPPHSGAATARPTISTSLSQQQQQSSPPSIVTPTSVYFSTTSSAASSPTTANTVSGGNQSIPASPTSQSVALPTVHQTSTGPTSPASIASQSTVNTANKRLSFLSYNDILTSTPAATLPLSSLTTSARSDLPPAHLPTVDAGLQNATHHGHGHSQQGSSYAGSDAGSLLFPSHPLKEGAVKEAGPGPLDEGGEWEREGFGMGLEERLEALELLSVGSAGSGGGGAGGIASASASGPGSVVGDKEREKQ